MTPDELMEPRYILENLWPGCQWGVGTIFPANFENFKIYPYLFRRLEWWEERAEKDMPAFVKYSYKYLSFYHLDDSHKLTAFKVKDYEDNPRNISVFDSDNNMLHHGIENYIPASEEEYTQYINRTD